MMLLLSPGPQVPVLPEDCFNGSLQSIATPTHHSLFIKSACFNLDSATIFFKSPKTSLQ